MGQMTLVEIVKAVDQVTAASLKASTEVDHESAPLAHDLATFVIWMRDNTDVFDSVYADLGPPEDRMIAMLALDYTGEST